MNYISQTRRRLQPEPHELALRELEDDPYATALARICAVARRESAALDRPEPDSPYRPAHNVCLDAFMLTREAFEDLITLTCASHGCERSELVSTGELVDLLGRPASQATCSRPSGHAPAGRDATRFDQAHGDGA